MLRMRREGISDRTRDRTRLGRMDGHKGFHGERPEYKCDCGCRKPKAGLLFQAAKDFNIDLSSSWMIGDTKNDVLAGINAGCKTALLSENEDDYPQHDIVNTEFDIAKARVEEEERYLSLSSNHLLIMQKLHLLKTKHNWIMIQKLIIAIKIFMKEI